MKGTPISLVRDVVKQPPVVGSQSKSQNDCADSY